LAWYEEAFKGTRHEKLDEKLVEFANEKIMENSTKILLKKIYQEKGQKRIETGRWHGWQ
jgi:hypothetical protein